MNEKDKDGIDAQVYDGEPDTAVAAAVASGQQALQIKTQYHTAVSVVKPRQLTKVRQQVFAEAELAGPAFYYHWQAQDRKNNRSVTVEGATVHLLDAIARYFGNLAVDIDERIEGSFWVFKVTVVDLETGYNSTRTYRQKIPSKSQAGKYDYDRYYVMEYQKAQSKARRNAMAGVVPKDIIDKAIVVAKDAVIRGITAGGIAVAREKVLNFFLPYGINKARIEAVVGPMDGLGATEIAELRNYAQQIKDGEVSADKIFPPIETEEEKPDPPPKGKTEKKKDAETPKPAVLDLETDLGIDPDLPVNEQLLIVANMLLEVSESRCRGLLDVWKFDSIKEMVEKLKDKDAVKALRQFAKAIIEWRQQEKNGDIPK